MNVLMAADGRVLACGALTLEPGEGQTIGESELTLADFAAADEAGQATGQPYDVTFDGSAFAFRNRAPNAQEQAAAAGAAADARDAATLAALYPRLAAQIPLLADPTATWAAADLAPVLADTLTALKGVVDRMERKGL